MSVMLGGCGQDADEPEPLSVSEYREAFLELDSADAESLYYDLVTDPIPQERCAGRIRSFEEGVAELVASIGSLTPPPEVAAIHERMVTAARESVARVRSIAEQVGRGEVECGNEINELLYGMPSSERALKALDELRAPVGLPSGE